MRSPGFCSARQDGGVRLVDAHAGAGACLERSGTANMVPVVVGEHDVLDLAGIVPDRLDEPADPSGIARQPAVHLQQTVVGDHDKGVPFHLVHPKHTIGDPR